MATITPSLSSKVHKDTKLSEVYIRFCGGSGKVFRVKTSIFADKSWLSTSKGKKFFKDTNVNPDARTARERLSELTSEIYRRFNEDSNDPSKITKEWLEAIVDEYHNPEKYKAHPDTDKTDVLQYLTAFLSDIKEGNKRFKGSAYSANTIKVWNSFAKVFADFYKSENGLKWDDVNKELTDRFIKYLERREYMVKTINKYIICFRALVGSSFQDGAHTNVTALTVFTKKRVLEEDKAREIYLTADELEALYQMDLNGLEAEIRDVFLVGCYTCQRFSDYGRLDKTNFTTTSKGTKVVKLVQQKTKNMVVIPILNDNLLVIAERYDFNIPQVSDVVLNRYIKKILQRLSASVPSLAKLEPTILTMKEKTNEENGKAVFIRDEKGNVLKPRYDLVSSHTARRSGVTNLYLSGKFDNVQMMSISGHKDAKTFREYIKLSSEEIADSIAEKAKAEEELF